MRTENRIFILYSFEMSGYVSGDGANAKTITVGYWGIRGLGAPLRMMVLYDGNYVLKSENYDLLEKDEGGYNASEWFDKKPELKALNPLINLPYVIDEDFIVSQSNACLTYLGRKFGMMGTNPKEESYCEQLLCECMDLRNAVTDFAYSKTSQTPQEFLKAISNKNGAMSKLELWKSSKSSSPAHFIGSTACAADFHIWEMIDQIASCSKFFNDETFMSAFPALAEFHQSFAALPQNQKYLSSALARLPQNNLMARFGATPSGELFVPGQSCPWRRTSGLY